MKTIFGIGFMVIMLIQISSAQKNSSICENPIWTGPCRAYMPRYAYDGNNCISFIYGGCQGNENNFETKESCEQECAGTIIACENQKECPACQECRKTWVTVPECASLPCPYQETCENKICDDGSECEKESGNCEESSK